MPQDLDFDIAKAELTTLLEEEATCAMVTHPDDFEIEANPYRAKFIWHDGKVIDGDFDHTNTRKVDVTSYICAILKLSQDAEGWVRLEDDDDDYGSACGEVGCNVEDTIEWDGVIGNWYTPDAEGGNYLLKSAVLPQRN